MILQQVVSIISRKVEPTPKEAGIKLSEHTIAHEMLELRTNQNRNKCFFPPSNLEFEFCLHHFEEIIYW